MILGRSILPSTIPITTTERSPDSWANRSESTNLGAISEGIKKDSLYVGFSSVDITPKKPVVVIGQMHKRIARTTLDPLTATVLALETHSGGANKEQAIMVSCDVIFIRKQIQQRIQDLVKKQIPDFDTSKLFLDHTA